MRDNTSHVPNSGSSRPNEQSVTVAQSNPVYSRVASAKGSKGYHHVSDFGRAANNGGCLRDEIQAGRTPDESRGNSSVIKRFRRIDDYLVIGVGSFATFLFGLTVGLVVVLFAFILILAIWRTLTSLLVKWRMVTCQLVISYLYAYLFGVFIFSAAFSWLEFVDGRSDRNSALVWSATALFFGLIWGYFRLKTKSKER